MFNLVKYRLLFLLFSGLVIIPGFISLILFQLGSGLIKGFAVTLAVGIITSFFTAVMVTRLIVITWLNMARPRKILI